MALEAPRVGERTFADGTSYQGLCRCCVLLWSCCWHSRMTPMFDRVLTHATGEVADVRVPAGCITKPAGSRFYYAGEARFAPTGPQRVYVGTTCTARGQCSAIGVGLTSSPARVALGAPGRCSITTGAATKEVRRMRLRACHGYTQSCFTCDCRLDG